MLRRKQLPRTGQLDLFQRQPVRPPRKTFSKKPMASLREEWKIDLPPHFANASKRIKGIIVEVLGKSRHLRDSGIYPSEFTAEAISAAKKKAGACPQNSSLEEKEKHARALSCLSKATKLAYLINMIETCSITAANEWYVQGKGASLRTLELQYRLDNIMDYLRKNGENPKMEKTVALLKERAGKRCLLICETLEQARALNNLAARVCPGTVVSHNPLTDKMGAEFDTVILYNPDKHGVQKAWENVGCEIIVLIALGTKDEGYWNQAKRQDRQKAWKAGKPGYGPELELLKA